MNKGQIRSKAFFCLLLSLSSLVVEAQNNAVYDQAIEEDASDNATNSSCVNGLLHHDQSCECNPCWQGQFCDDYVDYYAPRFLVHRSTAVVPSNVTGPVFRAWSSDEDLGLTCPLGPGVSSRCPCASVRYQLFSPPGDHHFILHPDTGILARISNPLKSPLFEGTTYTYKLMVQSTPIIGFTRDLLYDILDLDIFVGTPFIRKIPWT